MSFASTDFVLFLAVVFTVYFALTDRWRNAFLLAASYFFYGYWSWKYLLLLVFTMVLDYVIALGMSATDVQRKRKALLVVSIVANIGILFLFKYLGMSAELWSRL